MSCNIPQPRLTTAHSGPLFPVEEVILSQFGSIETWFRHRWADVPPPLMSSVDLRHAGYKLAPVDTNLFPAGFNNLNPEFLPMCVQAVQSTLSSKCNNILLIPENHTRNQYYQQSLAVLRDIFIKAGYRVRFGCLDTEIKEAFEVNIEQGENLLIEPLLRCGDELCLKDFKPCLVLLNNDLSSGVPTILQNLRQRVEPLIQLGWTSRLKSHHFQFYNDVVAEFCQMVDLDPWLINPLFRVQDNIDFMQQTGVEELAEEVDQLLTQIRAKYQTYAMTQKPFVVMKADNGTYGMSVMTVRDASELLQLNRKQRTSMATTKGRQKVTRVMLQEGVYSDETTSDGAVAEPVVYMMGQFVVGGFYRVHQGRGVDENLNAPGMHFEPLAFAEACNLPSQNRKLLDPLNRFYVYGVVARLAAMAASREIAYFKQTALNI